MRSTGYRAPECYGVKRGYNKQRDDILRKKLKICVTSFINEPSGQCFPNSFKSRTFKAIISSCRLQNYAKHHFRKKFVHPKPT